MIALWLALFVGCSGGGATESDAAAADARAADGSRASDAALDATSTSDASSDGGEMSEDAGVLARCPAAGPLPTWAERDPAAPHHVTLRGIGRDVQLWMFADGVLRVRYLPPGAALHDRSFSLVTPAAALPPAERIVVAGLDGDRVVLCTESMRVVVSRDGGRVLVEDAAGTALVEDLVDPASAAHHVVRATPTEEPFYGFGEKTGPLDKRGRRMTFYNTDAYDPAFGGWRPEQDPLYLSVPFFLGLRGGTGYGVFTDVAFRVDADMAADAPDRYRISTTGPSIDQYVIAGPALSEVVRRYTALTGRTPLPARWALGYHQSRWGYAPASRLVELARGFRDRGISADALWLDIQHMRGFRTFTFDPVAFADPEALASTLERDGLHLVVIADPGLKVDPGWDVYDEALAGGHLLRHADGSPYVGTAWPGDSSFVDFTSPRARAFWARHVGTLLERGVSGVWLDVNEPTVFPEGGGGAHPPDELPVDGDGWPTTLAEAHNVYALLQARATHEGMAAARPDRRPFVLSRAGFAGIQRYAAVWTGDAPSTWRSLRQTLPMLLGMGLSGVPFVGSDVGGYSGGATPELFARWMQLGGFSPFFRGHVTQGVADQEPWAFGPEVEAISRHRIAERYRFMPYLYSLFEEASRTGAPVLRPLVWHFQDDPDVRRTDDAAMVGPFLLVAPITTEGTATRIVHLPAGRWYDLESAAIWDGPTDVEVGGTLAATPVFVREGAILARTDAVAHAGERPMGPWRLDVYPSLEPSSFTLYDDDGEGYAYRRDDGATRIPLSLVRTVEGSTLTIGASTGSRPLPSRGVAVWVHRVDGDVSGVDVSGSALMRFDRWEALSAAGRGYFHDRNERALVVLLDDELGSAETLVEMRYDPDVVELRPNVEVTFEVTVPADTPVGASIHVASSVDGWTSHHPLAWTETPGIARGTLIVPRGAWFFYKYTRGAWASVEKWPGCVEADNRYGLGTAYPTRSDAVAAWADVCAP